MISEPNDQVELLRIGEDQAPIVISLSRFRGMRFIDIRRYYFDKKSKTTKPTPKGISLKEDEFTVISEFIVNNMESLYRLFIDNLNANELTFRGASLEKKARKRVTSKSSQAAYELTSWPAMEFFSIDASIATPVVNFNKKIKLISKIEHAAPDLFPYLKDIVVAYCEAKKSIQFNSKQNPSDILENIELEWTRNLNVHQ